ncbi:hypothetical protein V5N11_002788 [Cardamine amara subsp. amara]|uniref:DUF577 domain-containing protein n=1 Tax=Cardamine amara subsp. amara TaxID=228776 RepID=A0ABD1C6X5_CARAN
MAESDSGDIAMEESSNLELKVKARDLLTSPSHEGAEILVAQLSIRQETYEFQTALALFDFCVDNFPNCLALILLKVYRFSSNSFIRFKSIYLLSETLTELRNRNIDLSYHALHEIKPLLISCLTMEETKESDIKILSRIVSFVAYNIVVLNNGKWEELSDCILSLANTDPIRAFDIFIDLPSLYGEFIYRFLQKFLAEVYKVLLHPEDRVEDWILALKAAVKMGIQLMDSEMRFDLTRDILHIVTKCAEEVVWDEMEEEFLQQGLEDLEKFLAKDANFCKWNSDQCRFVAEFAFRISDIGTYITKEAAKKIYQIVTKMDKYVHSSAFRLSPSRGEYQDLGVESEDEFYNNLFVSSSVEIMRMVALTDIDDWLREVAILRLHQLLCDHTSMKSEIDVSEIRKLQPLLISCLSEVGIPESTFKILGQVVFHVALELSSYQEDNWFDLWDYIARECKTLFKQTVYIFQCLTMRLDDKEFVIPAINNLLPEIHRRLNLPADLLEDNSCWVLAFTGAFCAAIHLIEISSHAESLKELVYKMIDSVRELVERRMEVELVRRAFLDVESIVEKQVDVYTTNDYRFVYGLLWRLDAIKGMSMDSKIGLSRIRAILERVPEELKLAPKSELDWLNQPET